MFSEVGRQIFDPCTARSLYSKGGCQWACGSGLGVLGTVNGRCDDLLGIF